jgi:RNA polymerase sigma-70 factor (ECF subfamily)
MLRAGVKTRGTTAANAPRSPEIARPVPAELLADLDIQLMLQVKQGDVDAATMLVRRNGERVARFLGRMIRDPRVLEDLTQDVFVHVLESARSYQPLAKFSTWLYRIATNVALDHLNKVRKRPGSLDGGGQAGDVAADPEFEPDTRFGRGELRARVGAAIESLPPNQRVALTLFEYEELSYEQIARVLEVTVDAVRCLLSRARAALREKLAAVRERG